MRRLPGFTIAIALAAPTSAWAQDGFYVGAGLGSSSFGSDPSGYSASGSVGGGLLGYGGEIGGQGHWAVELGAETGLEDSADFRTLRLRGLAGLEIAGIAPFLSVGVAQQSGEPADALGGGTSTGMSYGIGVQFPVRDQVTLRVEMTRDRFGGAGAVSSWQNDQARVNFLFGF